jgi:hypothetical protein
VAELGPLRFRLVAIPVGKPDLDELVASLLEGSAMDVGTIEVPLSVTFEKHSPHGNLRVGGAVGRGIGFPSSRDPELDADVESEIARRQRVNATADQLRLERILFDLDHQRTMPQEDVERLSAEADAIRRRLEARGSQIVDVAERVHPRAVETGEQYAARLAAEDRTPHVETPPGQIPTPRDVPTPATIGHTPRSQAPRGRG